MKLFLLAFLSISAMTLITNHPLILVILISAQSLLVSLMIWTNFSTVWFSLVLFLIFMGGLMVLFIYISSLASNEMFKQTRLSSLTIMGLVSISLMLLFLSHTQSFFKSINLNFKEMILKIYSMNSMLLTFTMMTYLLVVLIVAVSIISMYEGPLRSMN